MCYGICPVFSKKKNCWILYELKQHFIRNCNHFFVFFLFFEQVFFAFLRFLLYQLQDFTVLATRSYNAAFTLRVAAEFLESSLFFGTFSALRSVSFINVGLFS